MRRFTWILLLAGCASPAVSTPARAAAPVVAVLPVLGDSAVAEDLTRALASELMRSGVRVVRAAPAGRSAAEVLASARQARADVAVVAAITDFDPYEPPRAGVSIQVLRSAARALSDAEVDRLVGSPSWRRGPVALSRSDARHWSGAVERVFDAHDRGVRSRIAAYAEGRASREGAFDGPREILAVSARFMEFVAHEIVLELLASGLHHES